MVSNNTHYLINEIKTKYLKGNFDEAKKLALNFIKQKPSYNMPWKILSGIYAKEGNIKKSINSAVKATKIDTDDNEAYKNLFLILSSYIKI